MKVLTQPDISGWNHEFTCQQCKSTLLAGPEDLYRLSETKSSQGYGGDYIDYKEYYFAVFCAVCDHVKEVPDANIPYLLQKQAEKRGKRK